MKKLIILISLIFTTSLFAQAEFEKIAITENVQDLTADKVNVQSTNGGLNWQLINDFQNNKPYFSTGLLKNGLLTINADNTKFNLSAGIGVYSDFSDPENVTSKVFNFPAFNAVSSPYIATSNITYVAVNYNSGSPTIVMQASRFSNTQLRDLVVVGAVVHSNFTTINTINNISSPSNDVGNSVADLFNFLGAKNQEGNVYSANGANLQLNKSAGVMFKYGANFHVDLKNPHNVFLPEQLSLTFRYRLRGGFEGTDRINIDTDNYDLNNVLTTVPPAKPYQIQTIFIPQTGQTRLQYGQDTYSTLADAIAAINTRKFVTETNLASQFVKVAYLVVKKGATSLNVAADADIRQATQFDGTASGGVALTYQSIIDALGYVPENVVNKVTDISTGANNTTYPTSLAVKIESDFKLNNSSFYQTPLKFYNQFIDQTKNANIVFLGDSNFDSPERMLLPFLKSLMYQKKSNGTGFFSFAAGTVAMGLNTATRTGTWIDTDIFAGGKGLDGRDAFSNTANSEITITTNSAYINSDLATYDNVRILYAKGAAGTVAYSINSGSYTNVILTTGSGDLGAFDIPMGSLSSTWNLKIKLISGEVRLLGGLITNNTDRGLIVNKTAHSGAASSHFSLLSNNQSWKSALSLTDPSIVFIGLTTNDFNNNIPSATTKANLTNLINNIKASVPSASVYMIAPPKSDPAIVPVQPVTAAINSAMLKDLTKELNVGFISFFDSWNKLPETYTNTLYADGVHYNALGAETNSNDLKRYLGLKQGNSNLINSLTSPNTNLYIPLNVGGNTFRNSYLKYDSGNGSTTAENNFKIEGSLLLQSGNSGLSAIFIDRVSAPNSRRFKFASDKTAQGLYEFQSERVANSGTYFTDFALNGITGNILFGQNTDNAIDKIQITGSGKFTGTITASPATVDAQLATLGQAKALKASILSDDNSFTGSQLFNDTVSFNNLALLKSYTVATLPTGLIQGSIAYVTDGLSPTYRATATGGGSEKCLVFYDGTVWRF